MSKLKHTPKPWFSQETLVYSLQDGIWLGHPAKENRFDANVQGIKCPQHEKEANARLIAAAPEMLQALIELYKWQSMTEFDISLRWMARTAQLLEKATGLKIEEIINE